MESEHLNTVFVIDDEEHIRSAIEQLFELQGFSVKTFADGDKLLSQLSNGWPGVIISDINMPMIDGHQLMAETKAVDPDIPTILLTGFGVKLVRMNLQVYNYLYLKNTHTLEFSARRGWTNFFFFVVGISLYFGF